MGKIYIPEDYRPLLDIKQTEIAIKRSRISFERQLATELNLHRVSAPLFVRPESGLNDNLNGVERPVIFRCEGTGRRSYGDRTFPGQVEDDWR